MTAAQPQPTPRLVPNKQRTAVATTGPQGSPPVQPQPQPQEPEKPAAAGSRKARRQARLATTPGRLRALSLLTVAAIALTSLLMVLVLSNRASHTTNAVNNTGPSLRLSQELYASLAAADTAAANGFVAGGIEPPEERERYDRAIANSTAILSELSAKNPPATTKAAIDRVSRNLPRYVGLVETARANNRQGFPVGAAYQRSASQLMQDVILNDARAIYDDAGGMLTSTYAAGGSAWAPALLVLTALVIIGLLVYLQAWLLRRTNRVFNRGVLAATAVAVAVFGFVFVNLINQASHLSNARTQGSESVRALAEVRFEGLAARKNEGLTLIARGGGKAYEEQAQAALTRIGSTDSAPSLLGTAASRPDDRAALADADRQLAAYKDAHTKVRAADDSGKPAEASALSLGEAGATFRAFDGTLATAIDQAQTRFDSSAAAASSSIRWLALVLGLGMLVTAVLTMVGVQERMQDYR